MKTFFELPVRERFLTYALAELATGTKWYDLTPEQRKQFKADAVREYADQEEVMDQ